MSYVPTLGMDAPKAHETGGQENGQESPEVRPEVYEKSQTHFNPGEGLEECSFFFNANLLSQS